MISVKDKIEIFNLSADIFSYPSKDWFEKLDRLKVLSGEKITTPSINLEEVESIYINFFEHNSSKYGIVPMASFWIDGKAMSVSAINIERFYNICGFKDNSFGPPDHISKMLNFCAVLLDESKFSEFEKFREWLYWLEEFQNSVEKALPIACYSEVLGICDLLLRENEV